MSRFSEIDLSAYSLPDILEALTVEAYLLRNKGVFVAAWNAIRGTRPPIDTLALEHEPVTAQLRVAAELERMLRGHVNDRTKQITLAGATGPMLDHLAMTYFGGLTRRVITPANAQTGAAAVMEDDDTFRNRIALSPESWSTCGPEGAYLFWALSASGDVLDVAAYSEDEGCCLAPRIRIVLLMRIGVDNAAASAAQAAVKATLNRKELRPMGDLVSVELATSLDFAVNVTLKLRPGASANVVSAAARARIAAYCEGITRWVGDGVTGPVWLIGRRLLRDTIAGRAYGDDPNIVEVVVTAPVADINAPAAGYAAALSGVGTDGFVPLASNLVEHLFKAPRLTGLTILTETATSGGVA